MGAAALIGREEEDVIKSANENERVLPERFTNGLYKAGGPGQARGCKAITGYGRKIEREATSGLRQNR